MRKIITEATFSNLKVNEACTTSRKSENKNDEEFKQ